MYRMDKQPIDLSNAPDDKKDILILGFTIAVPVLREFYKELIGKLPKDKQKEFNKKLDEVMPDIERGGFKVTLLEKDYKLIYKKIDDYKKYNLDNELAKIDGLFDLCPADKQLFLRELDIMSSAIPSVNSKYSENKVFRKFIKGILDEIDNNYNKEEAEKLKDIDLRINDSHRFYHMNDDDDALVYGIFIET